MLAYLIACRGMTLRAAFDHVLARRPVVSPGDIFFEGLCLLDEATHGGVRSVCCLRWPARIHPGTVVPQLAGAIDLMPTLAGLAGIDKALEVADRYVTE